VASAEVVINCPGKCISLLVPTNLLPSHLFKSKPCDRTKGLKDLLLGCCEGYTPGNNGTNNQFALKISPRISGTYNGGTEPYKAILGLGFPLHKPYIQLI